MRCLRFLLPTPLPTANSTHTYTTRALFLPSPLSSTAHPTQRPLLPCPFDSSRRSRSRVLNPMANPCVTFNFATKSFLSPSEGSSENV